MRLLLDTHVLVWAATDDARLGEGRELLLTAEERWVSAASTWELAIRQGLGKVSLGADVGPWVERAVRELAADLLPVTSRHAAAVEHLAPHHRDPFDRVLVAQARSEHLLLLTADARLGAYGGAVQVVR